MANILSLPPAGAFDPSDITLTDDTSGAFLVKEGSSEYMRINTTNGSELNQLKVPFTTGEFKLIQETSAGPYDFIKTTASSITLFPQNAGSGFSFNGMTINTAGAEIVTSSGQLNMKGSLPVSGSGARIYLVTSGQSWTELLAAGTTSKIQRVSDGLKMLEVDTDGNSTFTLDETSDGRFRIMGNGAVSGGASGAVTYLDIKSMNNNSATGEYIKLGLEPEANGRYFELTPSTAKLYCQNAKLDLTTAAATFTLYDDFMVRQYQSGKRILVCEDAQNSHEALTVDKTADSTFNLYDINSGVTYAPAGGSDLKVTRRHSGGTADVMTLKGDTDFTYTLKYDSSGTAAGGDAVENNFTIGTDRTGGSAKLLEVTTRKVGLGEGEGVFFAGPTTSQVWVSGPSVFRVQNASLTHNMHLTQAAQTYLGGTSKWEINGVGGNIAKVEHDSAITFTLDDGSGAAFKVVNDAGSPKTFLSIADAGDTTLDSESATFLKAQGHQYLRLSTSELQIGATGKFNVMHNGTPMFHRSPHTVSLGATSTTTIVNIQADGSNKNFKLNPSTTSQTFTFEFQDSTSANGGFVVEQHFVIQNYGSENCTIQATVTSGRGSALGKDLSAGGSTSGELVTGMTLNAGKSAVFKAVKWNKEINGSATASGNEFMFQTIMVEA